MTKRRRQRTCRACHKKFYPDYRQRQHQRHCPGLSCQTIRRSQNIKDWYLKNPDCLKYQQELTRRWFKEHLHYQKTYRLNHPQKVCKNRQDAKTRMRRLRDKKVFDKTNSIMSQLIENKADKCYLNAQSGWVHLCLIKQTRYTKHLRLCQTPAKVTPRKALAFGTRLYDLGSLLVNQRPP